MEKQKKPNILLILTDQHRLSALGSYGKTPCHTPNLDRLAKEGVRFENAYTTCPVCSPARASIISGQYPYRHGVSLNSGGGAPVWNIPNHPRMLSRRLIEQGYSCGYTGKWHLCPSEACTEWFNQEIPHHVPSTLGFEGQDFMGHGGGGFGYQEYKDYLKENDLEFVLKSDSENPQDNGWPAYAVQDGPVEATVDHFLANHTMSLIDSFAESDSPFFIWHNHWGPHEPYYPVEEFFAQYRDVEIPPWPNFDMEENSLLPQHDPCIHPKADELGWDYWQQAIRHYYAFTSQIDYEIGRIFDHLETSGQLDDTIIIFSSDHGEALGSHGGMINKGYSHFEETERIGMLIRYPEKYRPADCVPGAVYDELVSLVDIYPTCLNLAGVPIAGLDSQGASLHGLLNGQIKEWRDSVFVEFTGLCSSTFMVTCRCGDWKYGWNVNGTDELYNLHSDPDEVKNLAEDPAYRQVSLDMLGKIANHFPKGGMRGEVLRRRNSLIFKTRKSS